MKKTEFIINVLLENRDTNESCNINNVKVEVESYSCQRWGNVTLLHQINKQKYETEKIRYKGFNWNR